MIKMQMIGHLGKDATVNIQGTESVINFSLAHTDKYMSNGTQMERTTWVSCYWWVESTKVAQYLKKGGLVYVEGFPEARSWTDKEGKHRADLRLRVFKLELLGGKREDNQGGTQQSSQAAASSSDGYKPYSGDTQSAPIGDDDLPF